jgi:GNAT superfamily N-acetyltransferase
MHPQFVVRDARVDDAEDFVRAHEASWDAGLAPIVGRRLGELSPFDDRVAHYRAGIAQAGAESAAWVAERVGNIVGVAVRVGAELRDLYVVPSSWGTGVATELMTTALDEIRKAGAPEATLWVGADNARARRFYEREGWVATTETRAIVLDLQEVRYRRAV